MNLASGSLDFPTFSPHRQFRYARKLSLTLLSKITALQLVNMKQNGV